jgi:hypothetical protein
LKPQPLALLNDEGLHGLKKAASVSRFDRRRLNHRNSVTNPADYVPSAENDISIDVDGCQKREELFYKQFDK